MGLKASRYEVKKPEICLTCRCLLGGEYLIPCYCTEHGVAVDACGICDEYERRKE